MAGFLEGKESFKIVNVAFRVKKQTHLLTGMELVSRDNGKSQEAQGEKSGNVAAHVGYCCLFRKKGNEEIWVMVEIVRPTVSTKWICDDPIGASILW